MAALALWAGEQASRNLSPGGAARASSQLDKLEMPGAVPDAPLVRDDGQPTSVFSQATEPRTIVSFYAPWCAPCQEELPMLVSGTGDKPQKLLVVVAADENPQEVRDKLDNLGLTEQRFHVDHSGRLQSEARVEALPTTLLIGRKGRIHERVVGFSRFRLQMLMHRANQGGDDDHEL
jgi:thiol-disulfide isomerase/thioredoxin